MSKLNYEHVFNTLVEETAKYITKNNLKAMVLGISGGIDSTVVAAICHEVSKKTGIPLIGRSLPIKNKSDEFDVSELVGQVFCDDFKVVNLLNMYQHVNQSVYDGEGTLGTPISKGNIQARLRMIYLYNLASIHKGLVMSTDNQTEYQLGFWTIHGDVGDFDPIQGLWKTEVYGLANWLVEKYKSANEGHADCYTDMSAAQKQYALEQSIALTPTDGLGISNSDLDQIGAKSYDEVDDILQTAMDNRFSSVMGWMIPLIEKYGEDVVNKVWGRHLASEFKRKKAPIYISRKLYE